MEQMIPPENPVSSSDYPVDLHIEYPDRQLERLSSFFRLFWLIPIGIVYATISGGDMSGTYESTSTTFGAAGGVLFFGPLLMILFREKYPRWWFDWNRELTAFGYRLGTYGALMTDRYPSTDDHQHVRLELPYPEVKRDLNRAMPLVKWLLAIPHFIILFLLIVGAFFAVIAAWFAILFTGRFPRGLFDYLEGVGRWGLRVQAYAVLLTTDQYPPFRLSSS